jgi:hypothetical protein
MVVKLGLVYFGKNRWRIFENRVLRRVSGLTETEETGGLRSGGEHDEELHNFTTYLLACFRIYS